jgi:hypothetical protein
MPIKTPRTKPVVPLGTLWFATPGRNYLNALLRNAVETANPESVLDAGAGLLRNFELFTGAYTGIGIDRIELRRGLDMNANLITPDRMPVVYELNMDEDFGFLGPFDFCACTATLLYMKDKPYSLTQMTETLSLGGSLFFDIDDIDLGKSLAHVLEPHFENTYVIYFGGRDLPQLPEDVWRKALRRPPQDTYNLAELSDADHASLQALVEQEMQSSASPEDNQFVLVYAQGKKAEFAHREPPFKFVEEDRVWCRVK